MNHYIQQITRIAQEVGLCPECPRLSEAYFEAHGLDTQTDIKPGELGMSHELRYKLLEMSVRSLKTYLDKEPCSGPISSSLIPIIKLSPEAQTHVQDMLDFISLHPELAPIPETSHDCPPLLKKTRWMQEAIFGSQIQFPE